jgi:hypothetical protein
MFAVVECQVQLFLANLEIFLFFSTICSNIMKVSTPQCSSSWSYRRSCQTEPSSLAHKAHNYADSCSQAHQ